MLSGISFPRPYRLPRNYIVRYVLCVENTITLVGLAWGLLFRVFFLRPFGSFLAAKDGELL